MFYNENVSDPIIQQDKNKDKTYQSVMDLKIIQQQRYEQLGIYHTMQTERSYHCINAHTYMLVLLK